LAWFLTTPNRFVRDRATKAIVTLLAPRLHLVAPLLHQFQNVNDPYISERLYAIACGAAMRSRDNAELEGLAREVYALVFTTDAVVPHLLLRDYARQVVEIALHRGLAPDIDPAKVRPPYGSSWPDIFPTPEEVERYKGDAPDGMGHIYFSVMGEFGDFGRYDVDNRLGEQHWSARRLGAPVPPTREKRYNDFTMSLTQRQSQALNTYVNLHSFLGDLLRHPMQERLQVLQEVFSGSDGECRVPAAELEQFITNEGIEEVLEDYKQTFLKTLGAKKRDLFGFEALPYIKNPWSGDATAENLDTTPVQRWIVHRVFELGWTKERFGVFDRYVNYQRGDRTSHKAERVGKKYQWLALHEIAARLADNFVLKDDDWHRTRAGQPYEGPWQPWMRDIDPSLLLSRTCADPEIRNWWCPVRYDDWRSEQDDFRWIGRTSDLPPLAPLIEVTRPTDGSRWLVLKSYTEWHEPLLPGREKYGSFERRLRFWLKSYLVRGADKSAFREWASQQNLAGRRMPESGELHQVFWGELFWSSAFGAQNSPYYGRETWVKDNYERVPVPLHITDDEYAWEGGDIDCSLEEGIRIKVPSAWIADQMGLRVGRHDGSFEDSSGKTTAFDPSMTQPGPSALLLERESLRSFLKANNYDVVWILTGEKQVLSMSDYFPGRLEISGVAAFVGDQLEVASSYNVLEPRGQRRPNRSK
jgi:hypothetical protein